MINATLGDCETADLTAPEVEGFELTAVRPRSQERRSGVWLGLCLMRAMAPVRVADFRCDGGRFRGVQREGHVSVFATGALTDVEWVSRPAYHLLAFPTYQVEDALARTPVGRRPQVRSHLQVDDPMLEGLFAGLVEEAERGWPKGVQYAEWYASCLLARLVEACTDQEGAAIDGAHGLSPRQLARALELIEQAIDSDISLAQIANAVGLSRFHFARAFRRSTGVPPIKHLINRRLDRAYNMLGSGQTSVIEAAVACGYENTTHFTRAFRARYGPTPVEFLKLHRS